MNELNSLPRNYWREQTLRSERKFGALKAGRKTTEEKKPQVSIGLSMFDRLKGFLTGEIQLNVAGILLREG